MKCKPGDLAIIISNRFENNVGAFVRVREVAFTAPDLGTFWKFEKASKALMLGGYGDERYQFVSVRETTPENRAYLRDDDLQPIRPPERRVYTMNVSELDEETLAALRKWM